MKERGLRSPCGLGGRLGGSHTCSRRWEAPVSRGYVGIDLHRHRSVLVRRDDAGETLELVRIANDPVALAEVVSRAGESPGGPGGDLWVLLGGGCAGGVRRPAASGAPARQQL